MLGDAAALAAKGPVAAAAPHQIAGPSSADISLAGMSVARDGTGAVVFLSGAPGAGHVFVSRLIGGVFQAPEQVDTGLSSGSSQPVLAAGNKGVLLVAFINSGDLYEAQATGASAPFSPPVKLHTGAEYPSLQLSNWGKAYLAFTALPKGGGHDIDVEYYDSGAWKAVSAPLNVTPGDDAGGAATTRPSAAVAGDGVGIVAWGEAGHIYARRVWGTSPSVVDEQLDPSSFGAAAEVSAGSPVVSMGGDSSYPDIVYDERLSSGHRVLMTRLISEDVGPTVAVDSPSGTAPANAGLPAIAMSEYGRGFVLALAGNGSTDQLIGTPLSNNGVPGAPAQINPAPGTAPIAGVPAVAGTSAVLLAWEQSPASGFPQVLGRYASDGTTLGSAQLLSASGAQLQPGDGLAAAGDNSGDAAVAWVQGSTGALVLESAQLYEAPAPGQPAANLAYVRAPTPRLRWGAGEASWGPLHYRVTLSGAGLGSTSATSLQVPEALIDGPHRWMVTTVNPAGETATSHQATVFVDTVAPVVTFGLRGRRRAHRQITLRLHASDVPADQSGARASGVAKLSIIWGDGLALEERGNPSQAQHVYSHRGEFRIRVRVTDRAGNEATATHRVRIAK